MNACGRMLALCLLLASGPVLAAAAALKWPLRTPHGTVNLLVQIEFSAPAPEVAPGRVAFSGVVGLAELDAQLLNWVRQVLARRGECELQLRARRLWLDVVAAALLVELRAEAMQPLCGKLRRWLGGPLVGPSSALNATVRIEFDAGSPGQLQPRVADLQLWTEHQRLDRWLARAIPALPVRRRLQALIDTAMDQAAGASLAALDLQLTHLAARMGQSGQPELVFGGSVLLALPWDKVPGHALMRWWQAGSCADGSGTACPKPPPAAAAGSAPSPE